MRITICANERDHSIEVWDEYDDLIWSYEKADFSKYTIKDIFDDLVDGEPKKRE